jgi:hypothetical protein
MIERLSHQCRAGTWNKNLKNSSYAIAAGEAIVSQFVCFNKLQVEAAAYFNNPSCKTQCEERKTRKNSHKNPEILKKEVSTNVDAA